MLSSQKNKGASFAHCLDQFKVESKAIWSRYRLRLPTAVLDNKLVGYEFASLCGVPTAKIIQLDVSIDELKFSANTVIKPMAENASKGVFISYSSKKIVYLDRAIIHESAPFAKRYAKRLLKAGIVRHDRWMSEELLKDKKDGLARDIKFYCFYGKVGLILDTHREEEIRRCWFDVDLNYIDSGKYNSALFKGKRDTILKELIKKAEKLSLEIPSPFVRIDFLVCDSEVYLGEFTPVPAGYDLFNELWDKKLGNMYVDAAVRLGSDIGVGKIFQNYSMIAHKYNASNMLENKI
ncbi:ATP-grasp fold amidoligase family protein [Wohlfahrtiimonas larvae]|uniref:ATP-grasp domain-containing protein n=1 Tax=Wohlfahrtiimonas larvae TaxID=1157986 RepID=A0ABP9MMJ9_9GAMM|nr:ATP-grasp fold amidoligase family protein [Wohlfahrtiimonas larvae]